MTQPMKSPTDILTRHTTTPNTPPTFSAYKEDLTKLPRDRCISVEGLVLFRSLEAILEFLDTIPFDRVLYSALLFYPVDYIDVNLLTGLVAHFLRAPTSKYIEALTLWVEECGDQFTDKSLRVLHDMTDLLMGTTEDDTIHAALDGLRGQVQRVQSAEKQPSFQQLFNPTPIEIDGFSMTLPRWMICSDYNVNILNKEFIDIPMQLMLCEHAFLTHLPPKSFYLAIFPTTREESNVKVYLNWSDLITRWVVYSIIIQKTEKIRHIAIANFLQIAVKLLEIRNFNSFVAVVDGLMHYAVRRMKKTIAEMSPEESTLLVDLVRVKAEIIFSDISFLCEAPSIPYIRRGIDQMTEILNQEHEIDDTQTNLPDEALSDWIDATKALAIGGVISHIRRATGECVEGTPIKQMNEFFLKTIHSLPLDNTLLLNKSIEAEPLR